MYSGYVYVFNIMHYGVYFARYSDIIWPYIHMKIVKNLNLSQNRVPFDLGDLNVYQVRTRSTPPS